MLATISRALGILCFCAPAFLLACTGGDNSKQVRDLRATVVALQQQVLQASPTAVATAAPAATLPPAATPAATAAPSSTAAAAKAPGSSQPAGAQPVGGPGAAPGALNASEPLLIQRSVNGVGNGPSESIHLHAGFAVFAMLYESGRTFRAQVLDSRGNAVAYLVNAIGSRRYSGRTAAYIPADGDYVLSAEASGPWRANILQPQISDAKGRTFVSGAGDDVGYLQLLDGTRRIRFTYSGPGDFRAYLYNDASQYSTLVDETGFHTGTVSIPIGGGGGVFALVVEADGGYWTAEVQ